MRKRRYTYPENWKEISHQVRERAGWKCEQCGAPHGEMIQRAKRDLHIWRIAQPYSSVSFEPDEWNKPIKLVLTVHHIGVRRLDGSPGDSRDKSDNRQENLVALCQYCHLEADKETRITHAIETRRENRTATPESQLIMFMEEL